MDAILLLAFCLLIGLIALAVCVYLAVSGALLTLDGLSLVLICLSIGGLFLLNVVWSVYTGEFKQLLARSHKQPPSGEQSGKTP